MSKAKYNTLLSLGYDSMGRQIRKRITANTKAEFDQKIYNATKEYELIKNPSSVKFGEYAAQWVEVYQSMKSKRTYTDAKEMLKKFDNIKNIELKKVKQTDLQAIINDHRDHPRTCQLIKITFRQIFNTALEDGIIARSPAIKLSTPAYVKKERRALSISEACAVEKVQLEPLHSFFLKTLYYFGLRPGEALGLMKTDFNLDKRELTISRSLAFDGNNAYIKPTKTYNERILPIPELLVRDLGHFLSEVDTLYIYMKENDLITKAQYRHMWNVIKMKINEEMGGDKNHDITRDLTPYIFRHNYATMLYYSNISMKQASKLMGHANTDMIMKVYAHIDESKENVREKINEMYNKNTIEEMKKAQ